MAMIALHERGQGIQKCLRSIQRIHMELRFILIPLIVRIKHHGRNVLDMPFRADKAALLYGNRIANHDCANVAGTKNGKRSFN